MRTIPFPCLFVAADEKRWTHTCPIAGCMGAKGQRGEPGPVGPQVGLDTQTEWLMRSSSIETSIP